MDTRPNLILSPHFDDAVLSLGGLIAKAPDQAVIVTVFAGAPAENVRGSWDRWSGFATGAAAVRARSQENDEALAVLGVPRGQIHNLGYLDNQYRLNGAAPGGLRSAIAGDIRRLVGDRGGRVNVLAPAMVRHPDHRIVAEAALEVRRSGVCPAAEFLLYQDQPYAYIELRSRSLAPLKFAAFAALGDRLGRRLGERVEPETIELSDSDIASKGRSIARYRSQFRGLKPLLIKMLGDFSYYQAREARLGSRHAEIVYRLTGTPPQP
jgi:LmbE family N-acetylglucosaminyl deacetylase